MNYEIFYSQWLVLALYELRGFFPLMHLAGSSIVLGSFLTCVHWWEPSWVVAGTLYTSLELSTSLLSYLQPLAILSPWTPSYVSSTLGDSQALPLFYIRPTWPRNALWEVSQGNQRSHLTSFQSFRDHHSSLPNGQCLKNCCFIYFACFLVVLGRRVNLFPVTPIWPESKVIFYFKHNKHTCFITFSDNSNTCNLCRSVVVICSFCQILCGTLFPSCFIISDCFIKILREGLLLLGRSGKHISPIPPTNYN